MDIEFAKYYNSTYYDQGIRIDVMNTNRIRMGHPYGQTPTNVYSDFDWIRQHETELQEKYGECSIIVYQQQVIGVGATYAAALENAENNLPPIVDEITPVHQWLQYRHPILRVHPKSTAGDK